MLSQPPLDEDPEARALRSHIFSDLDRLAFALEMEAASLVDQGRHEAAKQRQCQRLGLRLAQRLVSGVWADEVNLRLQQWAPDYEERIVAGVS